MADSKISALAELAAAPDVADELVIVDKSDTSMAASGTDKRIKAQNLVPVDAAAATGSLRTLGTGATQATAGNDSRLTNARTPTAHATTHQPGGSDAMAVDAAAATGSLRTLGTGAAQAAAGNDTRFPAGADIVDADVSGTAAIAESKLALASDAAAGTASRRTLGTGATQAAAGNDSRLSDSRTPTAHHTSHEPGGSDAMAVDAAAGTGSLRTLGTTSTKAAPGDLVGVYRFFHRSGGGFTVAAAAATNYLCANNTTANSTGPSASSTSNYNSQIILTAADLALSGLTTKLRVTGLITTVATAPAVNFVIGLYPLTISAGNFTLGTVVAGSTVTINAPAANALTSAAGSDFTIPADGTYAFGYTVSGTPAANGLVHGILQWRNV